MNHKNKIFKSLKGEDFSKTKFENCKFQGEISFTSFKECKFISCDFSNALLRLSSFTNCSFSLSKLSNLDFGNVSVNDCDFSNAVFENTIFQKISGKFNRKKFDLRSCKFENVDLVSSVFSFCNLEKVSFKNSDLRQAVFELCDLKETNFSQANIEATSFRDCTIDRTILDLEGFIKFGSSKGFILSNE